MDIKTAAQHLKADDFPMRIGMKFAQNTPIFQVDFDTKKQYLNYTNDYAELINRFKKGKAFNMANPGKAIDHLKAWELGQEILKVYYRMVNTFGVEKIDPELHKAMKDTETMYADHMTFEIHNETTFKEKYPEMAKEVFKEES
jgi:hypothetical protein